MYICKYMNNTWKYIAAALCIVCLILAYFLYKVSQPKLALNQMSINEVDREDIDYKNKQNPAMAKDLNDYFYKNPTQIRFLQDLYDFDTVNNGVDIRREIKYINLGTQPYFITDIKVSCGCTIPSYDKEPVKPNDTGVVKVEFKSASKSGFVMNKLSLYGNTDIPEKSVYFKVYVKDKK
jgi:hypothetical protein